MSFKFLEGTQKLLIRHIVKRTASNEDVSYKLVCGSHGKDGNPCYKTDAN